MRTYFPAPFRPKHACTDCCKTPVGAILLIAALVSGIAWGEAPPAFDQFGGITDLAFPATGFFHTIQDDGRWWLVTPEGHAFLSLGVNHLSHRGDRDRTTGRRPYEENVQKRYGSEEAWAAETAKRFQTWGLNTVGAWSVAHLNGIYPYTVILSMAGGSWTKDGAVPDFFSPEFEAQARIKAEKVRGHTDNPYLLGYFLDNELPWSPDHRLGPDLFKGYLQMAPEAPGKLRFAEFMKERYETPAALAEVYFTELDDWAGLPAITELAPRDRHRAHADRDAFALVAARQYFSVSTEAIRAVDPNHLILGCRFIWQFAIRSVVQACGEYCDVVSVNFYENGPLGHAALRFLGRGGTRMPWDSMRFASYHEITGKPLMITEFSFRGGDGLPPNTYPPGIVIQPVVKTQRDRADKYERYVGRWAATPWFVGAHWFQYADEPAGGRFDGENGNYGLVDIADEPYADLVNRIAQVTRRAWTLHREATWPPAPAR